MAGTPFGDEVRRLRGERSQADLSAAVGISQGFLSKLELGERDRLGADVLFKLCKALGVSCDHFARFFDDPAPEPQARPLGKRK